MYMTRVKSLRELFFVLSVRRPCFYKAQSFTLHSLTLLMFCCYGFQTPEMMSQSLTRTHSSELFIFL